MTIGERIRNRRLELGMNAGTLAHKLGLNRATIYRYENNEIEKLPTSVLEPLAKALLTTPAELLGWTESAPAFDGSFCVTEFERSLIIAYRSAPESRREAVRALLEIKEKDGAASAEISAS